MTFVLTSDDGPLTDDDGEIINYDTRAQAEDKKTDLKGLFDNLTIEQRGVEEVEADVVDMSTDGGNSDTNDDEPLPGIDICSQCGNEINDGHCPDCDGEGGRLQPTPSDGAGAVIEESVNAIETVKDGGLETDPLNVLPEFMKDTIKGTVAVKKRGYAMIAERYDIEVSTEMIESPWDNEEGRVVCKATATTDDGKTYNAYGTACAGDGDDDDNLIELADTRSQKRAVQWASGFGIVSYAEMTDSLEEEQ